VANPNEITLLSLLSLLSSIRLNRKYCRLYRPQLNIIIA